MTLPLLRAAVADALALVLPISCAGCGLETCIVEQKKCLTSVTVDEVMTEVKAVLGPGVMR